MISDFRGPQMPPRYLVPRQSHLRRPAMERLCSLVVCSLLQKASQNDSRASMPRLLARELAAWQPCRKLSSHSSCCGDRPGQNSYCWAPSRVQSHSFVGVYAQDEGDKRQTTIETNRETVNTEALHLLKVMPTSSASFSSSLPATASLPRLSMPW